MTTALIVAAVLVALVDWYAVSVDNDPLEYLAKPAVMVLLIAATVLLPGHESVHTWIIIGLSFSLLGDIILMLPNGMFEAGLGAFLLAHCAYIVAFWQGDQSTGAMLIGAAVVTLSIGAVGRQIVSAARESGGGVLAGAVTAYIVAIAAMGISGIGTASVLVAVSSMLFVLSDSLLGWARFVSAIPFERTLVHITYHLAQIGFVLWLV